MPLRRPVGVVALLAMVASLLALMPVSAANAQAGDPAVFINEVHYDNASTDVGEFVEVAGPAGTDLTGWDLVLYNGGNNAPYTTTPLTGTLADAGAGYGFSAITYPTNGIQNGSPDGVALVNASNVLVQFLSYEGVMTAASGPASGVMSTDIGVAEAGTEPAGQSLQLAGTGDSYGDFTWQAPADDTPGAANNGQTFQAAGAAAGPVPSCPSTLSTDQGTATSAPVSATDADSRIVDAAIATPVAGISLTDIKASPSDGEPGTATLAVSDSTEAGSHDVAITFSSDDDQSATCTVAVTVAGPAPSVKVHQVQGSGAASPRVGERVTVEAVVTSVITSRDVLDGFFVQEEDADADSDPATSEGVYVFCRAACRSQLAAGDRVRVTGTVAEFNGSTQIDATGDSASIVRTATAQPLPTAAVVTLPASASTSDAATFESVEGMRTTIGTTLVVSEYFNLARFGELVLTATERPYQFTETSAPSEEGYAAHLAELAKRRLTLDDNSNDQNDATSGPEANEPYYYPTPGLSAGNYVRGGDTITNLTGVFEYSFGAWKLRPVAGADYTFERANPRPTEPEDVGGRLKVASFNVLNYFATIDQTSSNSSGTCAPSGTADCRGADSEAERERQLAKIVAALKGLDADVYGLIEIQNDDGAATAQIVDALNAATGAGTYDHVRTGTIGTDAIKQAFLYRTATVQPAGDLALLTSEQDARFVDTRNRPALIQTFSEVATGEKVTVAVNHLKSKGSACGDGDDSPADGSGSCDGTRTKAAQALADYLATDPTDSGDSDRLIIGDLNSYSMERPITTLEQAGYTDLLDRFDGDRSYGYVFDGQLGHLDHALASASLNEQVTGAGGWKINADELPLLDYNDTVKDAGEADFERTSSANELYTADPYRSSDHDPVVVGLALGTAPDRIEPRAPQSEARGRAIDDSCPSGQVPAQRFSDVPAGDIHALAIRCMDWWDVARGYADGTYRALAGVTHGQMASFVARTITEGGGTLQANPANAFPDDDSSIHHLAINQLAAEGIVLGGSDGRYDADGFVTRAQMASYLVRAYKDVTGVDLPLGGPYFDDVAGRVQVDDINWAAAVGLTGGIDGDSYGPAGLTLRGQMATFLARLLDLFVEDGTATTPSS